ncbi:hypothetical protein K1719_019088 [Acacia pycnantha]|nr:hypothetical protein K1719_019088 [Acacia pycnantha]
MLGSNTNLVTTVIGFGMSATFIVFVCTRIICGRWRGSSQSHNMLQFDPRMDIEQPENLVNRPEPVLVTAIPTMKFDREAFSSIENTQCVICLAEYKERENSSETKHVRPVTFSLGQGESQTSESRDSERNIEPVPGNPSPLHQSHAAEAETRQ